MGTDYFEGMFSLQVKEGSNPYQAPPENAEYTLPQPFKEELERLQNNKKIIP